METESPVFIVGAPRSGTSLLYRILQHHSSLKLQNIQNSSKVQLTESLIFQ
ncbi:sulfotransferase [Crocosphaera sp. Alani8]|uniref:sulfotransferase n=1 Tax=Crocosphaera sp. Alani8 TaxID=3038952 RepID=UPI00406CF4F7